MALFKSTPRTRHSSPSSVPRRHNKIESLVASGFRIKPREADVLRRLIQPWQGRSFNYYDQLGEIKYASQFYSRMLAPLVLFPAIKDQKGDIVETDNAEAVAALERIQDPGGGRTGLLSSYGRLMFLTGECYLFVSTDDGIEQWEMLSADELRIEGSVIMRYKAPSLGAEEYKTAPGSDEDESAWVPVDEEAVAYRLWQRHPRFSMLADSTMQGVLDLCEELVLLTKAVRARARSRLAGSGILFIDERISPLPPEPGPDEDVVEDEFLNALVEAMTSPIADEGAASQVVPLIVRVPAPGDNGKVEDLTHHLQIIDPMQLYPETGLRYECIKRIAIGLDMPPEILLGMEDSNHWTAWQIGEETWKGHGQPKAQQLCDDLTASYFRPYLAVTMGEEAAKNFYISYDATSIINHPDRTKDAKELYDKRAIGKRALREAAGFDEEDAPTKEELAEMIGVATRDASLAWFGTPAVRGGEIEVSAGEVVGPDDDVPAGPTTGAEVEPGPPPSTPQDDVLVGSSRNGNGHHDVMVSRILGAADLAVLRAREAAGSRLLSLAKRDSAARDRLKGVRTGEIAATLGRATVKALRGPSERELVQGARELIVDTFRVWEIHDDALVTAIADTVEQHAARTLYDRVPRPLPLSFKDYVTGLITSVK